jgi:DNA-binding MarR family transcriptional regulator
VPTDPSMNERLDERIGYLVKRVQHLVRVHLDQALRGHGLTMAQFAALRVLAGEQPLPPAELGRRCFTTRQSAHEVLAGLTRRGLVTQSPGRGSVVTLTDAGYRLVADADPMVAAVEQRLTAGLDAAARTQLAAALEHCAQNLETPSPAHPKAATRSTINHPGT